VQTAYFIFAIRAGVRLEMTANTDNTPPLPTLLRRDPTGRFEAWTPLHELLDGVAEVARVAAEQAGCPAERVSKAAWDRGRAAVGRLDLPTAEAVRKRFGRSWVDVLQVALGAPAGRVYRLGVLSAHPQSVDDDRLIIPSLRWAALQIGQSPRPAEYDIVVEPWNRSALKDPLRPLLPVSETILRRIAWAEAIRRAGLAPLGNSGARRAQALAVLIDRCITETGVVPTKQWFRQWARVHDIRVGRIGGDNEWGPSLEAGLRAWTARGGHISDTGTPLPVLPAAPSRRRRCTREDAIRSLRAYGERYLQTGQPPRQKHYQVCSASDKDLISSAVLGRFGRFQDLCREAGL
jgi:hypothetical protein